MFMVASSCVTTIMVLNYHHRMADTHDMPEWVRQSLNSKSCFHSVKLVNISKTYALFLININIGCRYLLDIFHTTPLTRFLELIFLIFLFPLYCSDGPFVKRIHTSSREVQVTLIAFQIVSNRKKLPRNSCGKEPTEIN